MATSSASIIPDSEPLRIAESIQAPIPLGEPDSPVRAAVHVAPKRTYGRSRPSAPALPVEVETVGVDTPAQETFIPSSTYHESLDRSPPVRYPRISGDTSDWRRRLELMDAQENDDDEVDDDEVARFMAEQNGKALEPMMDVDIEMKTPTAEPLAKLLSAASSSSLPPLTSSSLPPLTSSQPGPVSSPTRTRILHNTSPQVANHASSSYDEETAPIQRPTASRSTLNGKKRILFSSPSEDEEETSPQDIHRSPSEHPSSQKTPQPTHSRRKRNRLESFDEDGMDNLHDILLPDPESPLPTRRSSHSPRLSSSSHKTPKDRRSALQELARTKAMQLVEDEKVGVAAGLDDENQDSFVVDDDEGDFDVRMSGKGKRAKEVVIRVSVF